MNCATWRTARRSFLAFQGGAKRRLDIRALRQLAVDGPLSAEVESRPLLAASLSVAMVKNDDAGNVAPCQEKLE